MKSLLSLPTISYTISCVCAAQSVTHSLVIVKSWLKSLQSCPTIPYPGHSEVPAEVKSLQSCPTIPYPGHIEVLAVLSNHSLPWSYWSPCSPVQPFPTLVIMKSLQSCPTIPYPGHSEVLADPTHSPECPADHRCPGMLPEGYGGSDTFPGHSAVPTQSEPRASSQPQVSRDATWRLRGQWYVPWSQWSPCSSVWPFPRVSVQPGESSLAAYATRAAEAGWPTPAHTWSHQVTSNLACRLHARSLLPKESAVNMRTCTCSNKAVGERTSPCQTGCTKFLPSLAWVMS